MQKPRIILFRVKHVTTSWSTRKDHCPFNRKYNNFKFQKCLNGPYERWLSKQPIKFTTTTLYRTKLILCCEPKLCFFKCPLILLQSLSCLCETNLHLIKMAWINVALKITILGSQYKTELTFIFWSPFSCRNWSLPKFLSFERAHKSLPISALL